MEHLLRDARLALRALRRAPLLYLVAALSLALGGGGGVNVVGGRERSG